MLDEAYYEYVTDPDYADSMKYLHTGKNVLILRTFSKIYGLAGLRIGYGIAKKEILNDMNRLREPFNTNSIAQKAAIAALNDPEHVSHSRNINEAGKTYLYSELDSLGVQYVPTEANFLYIPVEKAMAVYEKLMTDGSYYPPDGTACHTGDNRIARGKQEIYRSVQNSCRSITNLPMAKSPEISFACR